mmetsp:Transcript_40403/g.115549  ORF Transcript_40403/g.115549 Transcript_40403/m.115549 type:complete len:318 (+) Transcript_40403:201-1154(+)
MRIVGTCMAQRGELLDILSADWAEPLILVLVVELQHTSAAEAEVPARLADEGAGSIQTDHALGLLDLRLDLRLVMRQRCLGLPQLEALRVHPPQAQGPAQLVAAMAAEEQPHTMHAQVARAVRRLPAVQLWIRPLQARTLNVDTELAAPRGNEGEVRKRGRGFATLLVCCQLVDPPIVAVELDVVAGDEPLCSQVPNFRLLPGVPQPEDKGGGDVDLETTSEGLLQSFVELLGHLFCSAVVRQEQIQHFLRSILRHLEFALLHDQVPLLLDALRHRQPPQVKCVSLGPLCEGLPVQESSSRVSLRRGQLSLGIVRRR